MGTFTKKCSKRHPHHEVFSISNDLDRLIPVGTLNFYDLPFDRISFASLATNPGSQDGWKWLDLEMIEDLVMESSHSYVKELYRMIIYRYVAASYRPLKMEFDGGYITVFNIRLYVVPHDIDGSRFFNEFRRSFSAQVASGKNFNKFWKRTLTMLDFSADGWNPPKKIKLIEYCNSGRLLVPFFGAENDLASSITQDCLNFHIERWLRNDPYKMYLNRSQKVESLDSVIQRIYNQIESPEIEPFAGTNEDYVKSDFPSSRTLLSKVAKKLYTGDFNLKGMKSHLYPFQMESLGKMLEIETTNRKHLVPNFIEVRSPHTKQVFYYDMLSPKIYISPELYGLPKGGILAENMGLGKTLICLSLICLTKFEVSTIPEDELAYFDDLNVSHSSIGGENKNNALSLFNICKNYILQNSLPWKFYSDSLPESLVDTLMHSQGSFKIPLRVEKHLNVSHRSRSASILSDKYSQIDDDLTDYHTLYLCSTTLVVVPDNLFHQWNAELKKHVQDSYLHKLFVSSHFKKPITLENSVYTNAMNDDVDVLASFDLILITISKLAAYSKVPYPDNPFNKMYWKRLIIDEGHVMHSKSSRASALCRDLRSQSRWAITGTPTSGLTKLFVNEELEEDSTLSPKKNNHYVVKNRFNAKEDLTKLGNILSNFLKVEPFHSQPKLWNQNIVRPLSLSLCGSHRSLANLLNGIMIRHNLNEEGVNLKLPQLHHIPVFLEPSYHNKLSINLFTAVLAVNAVSSERKDVDYMFHPANRQQLRKLISNLQRATFYWTSFKQEDVKTLISICETSLKKRKSDGSPALGHKDLELLERSIVAAKSALNTPSWKTASSLHEMNYYVSKLSDFVIDRMGMGVVRPGAIDHSDIVGVFGAPQLSSIQDFFYKNRFISSHNSSEFFERFEKNAQQFWTNYWNENTNVTFKGLHKEESKHDQESDLMNRFSSSNIRVPSEKSYLSQIRDSSFFGSNQVDEHDFRSSSDEEIGLLLENIKYARIIGTASSKLSYLASKLLENKFQKVKSIVFYEFEDSAYYLTELLDLVGIDYILYSTSISTAQRASNLSDFDKFSTKTGGVALIMDLKLASHGLTITAATKVFFMSPVWHRSVEAQAIKRAHRIGQTKEVFVETLILKGTLEEEIYKRRAESSESHDQENSQHQYVIDDTGMQEFILKHQFVDHNLDSPEYSEFITSNNEIHKSANGISQDSNMESNLPFHYTESIDGSSYASKWMVHLFTNDNLEKVSQLKNSRIRRAHFDEQFVDNFVSNTDINEDDVLKHDKISNTEKKKKVRF